MSDALKLIGICLLAVSITSCAAGMALHGKREPQIADLRPGMDIGQAHFILRDYTPAISVDDKGNRVEEYKIELGNRPSAGRAVGHLALDLVTLGWWEVIGVPAEGLSSGTMELRITYKDDKITHIRAGEAKEGL